MRRKVISGVLAAVLSISLAVPAMAAETAAPEAKQSQPSAAGEHKAPANSVLYYGKVARIEKGQNGTINRLVMESDAYGDSVMVLSGDTVWIDSGNETASDPSTLKVGEGIYVFHSPASASAQPSQFSALAIVRNIPQDISCAHYHVVEGLERQADGSLQILTDQGGLYLSADQETGLSRYNGKEQLALGDLKVGDRIMVWYQAILESYPARTHAQHLMLLPGLSTQQSEPAKAEPEEGAQLTMELDGKVPNMVGRYENGTAMVPVAAVAQVLGFQVTYTPKGHSALVTVESEAFQVRLDIGNPSIYGVTKLEGAVGMTAPQAYGKAPYIVAPGTTWAPARLFEMLGKTVTLDGTNLIIE